MKIVPDTNTVVSGLLWQGAPHDILVLARTGEITLYTSPALLAELRDVLKRPKFATPLKKVGTTAKKLSLEFAALAKLTHPNPIEPVILATRMTILCLPVPLLRMHRLSHRATVICCN